MVQGNLSASSHAENPGKKMKKKVQGNLLASRHNHAENPEPEQTDVTRNVRELSPWAPTFG
jgi:hypothetical protein